MQTEFVIETRGRGLYEFTPQVAAWAASLGEPTGLLTLFIRHTSASLLIQENADPDVAADLLDFFDRLVPDADDPSMSQLRHVSEGPDDMPAHLKAAMTPVSVSIPVAAGRLALGTWQGIHVFEHRDAPHRRRVAAHLVS